METIFESKTLDNGITVNVVLDHCPLNPREEYEHLGTLYANSYRHNWDNHMIHEIIDEDGILNTDGLIYAKVFVYEHGLVALSVSEHNPFSCPFDSALYGIIACTEEDAKKWLMTDTIDEERVRKIFEGEIYELEHYINGEVYGYELEDKNGEFIDGCHGFFEIAEALEEGIGYAEAI